jgi:hypothetical protein
VVSSLPNGQGAACTEQVRVCCSMVGFQVSLPGTERVFLGQGNCSNKCCSSAHMVPYLISITQYAHVAVWNLHSQHVGRHLLQFLRHECCHASGSTAEESINMHALNLTYNEKSTTAVQSQQLQDLERRQMCREYSGHECAV